MPNKRWWDELNQKFEGSPQGDTMPLDGDTRLAGGVTIIAMTLESPIGEFPALLFRFVDEHGLFMPPIALVGDDAMMKRTDQLVNAATHSAIRAAELNRRKKK